VLLAAIQGVVAVRKTVRPSSVFQVYRAAGAAVLAGEPLADVSIRARPGRS